MCESYLTIVSTKTYFRRRNPFLLRMVHVCQAKNISNLEAHCAEMLGEAVRSPVNMFGRDVGAIFGMHILLSRVRVFGVNVKLSVRTEGSLIFRTIRHIGCTCPLLAFCIFSF